ncbi:hypothetical protein, partial [Cyclobacterium sp. SYSU L10401]|uniref:hypothetical protein n=1 Tax=Cyclobacterium sp. SYSU L10401 TaxID=2678657 RepID=UPI001969D857
MAWHWRQANSTVEQLDSQCRMGHFPYPRAAPPLSAYPRLTVFRPVGAWVSEPISGLIFGYAFWQDTRCWI